MITASAAPDRPLRLLIVDDCEDDAFLIVRQFTQVGYQVESRRVDTAAAMANALADAAWDAVISDVTMPRFSAEAALALYGKMGCDMPFLVVSGVVSEENAVALLKAWAHDFLSKFRLARMVPAFERERREAVRRRAHRAAEESLRLSEERYALAARGANDGLWDWNLTTAKVYYSARWYEMLGLPADAASDGLPTATLDDWLNRIHPDDAGRVREALDQHLAGRSPHFSVQHRLRHAGGGHRWMLARGVAVGGEGGRLVRMAGSFTDITASKVAELRLRQAKDKIEAATAAKMRFLAAASHDMRQPVQALFCFSAVLAERLRHDHAVRGVLDDLDKSLSSLKELLDALLDVSKLDAGVVKPSLAAVAVRPVMERVWKEMAPQAAAKGLRLRMVPSSAVATSDAGLLARILRNLVENAVRYTERGGVVFGCRRRGERILLQVWDSGIGIPERNRDMIFEEFFQLGNSERDRRKGLGLGLAIVSRLSRLLDHPVDLRSCLGKGSMFSVALPRVGRSAAEPADLPAACVAPGYGWVVVIDDERMVAEALASLIRTWGYRVTVAQSADDAVSQIAPQLDRCGPPQAVVADYRLGQGRTGLEAIAAVRSCCRATVPSVVLTGDTASDRLNEIDAADAAMLHKPVPPAELRQVLGGLVHPPAGSPYGRTARAMAR